MRITPAKSWSFTRSVWMVVTPSKTSAKWLDALPAGVLGPPMECGIESTDMAKPVNFTSILPSTMKEKRSYSVTAFPAGGGIRDGEIVLDLLANDRATWRHISYQLCQRLVCDEPPISIVNKCIDTWQRTDGNLREIVKTIVTSPEFFSPVAMRKKIKSPFEYAVSSVRALDGSLDPYALVSRKQLPREANSMVRPPQGGGYLDMNNNTLLGQIGTMGEPIFQYQAPTGFPEDSRKWVSSGALISRLNFSLSLTQGRINDVKLEDPAEDAGSEMNVNAMIDRVSNRILHGQISSATRATLLREAQADSGTKVTPATIAALLLGSPEFQRR